jgi:hypothetical protein
MSDSWLIEAASTSDALPMLHCIEQLRLQLYQHHCPEDQRSRTQKRLALLEHDLYDLGVRDQKRIADIKDELTKLSYPDDQEAIDKDLKERKQLQGDIKEIKRLLVLPTDEPLILAFEDYPRHLQKFSTGVEYDAIGDFLKNGKGAPRIGYTVEMRFGGSGVSELYPEAGPSFRLGVHEIFSAFLTSSAENSLVSGDSNTIKTDSTNKPNPVFQFEDAVFFPIARTGRFTDLESPVPPGRLRSTWGPIVVIGARMDTNDSDGKSSADRITERHYFGFRESIGPFLFNDILIGRTRGLRHTRLEVRGQIPIMKLSATSRIVLGAEGNFSIRKPQRVDQEAKDMNGMVLVDAMGNPLINHVNTEPDTIRLYLSWDANFALPKSN